MQRIRWASCYSYTKHLAVTMETPTTHDSPSAEDKTMPQHFREILEGGVDTMMDLWEHFEKM